MRVAVANAMSKKNPGQFAFIKTALDAEGAKHDVRVKAARERIRRSAETRRAG